MVESHGSSPTATIAELVSSGAGVLAVAADASRRAALANGASGLARFNGVATKNLPNYLGWRRALEAWGDKLEPPNWIKGAIGNGPRDDPSPLGRPRRSRPERSSATPKRAHERQDH